MSQEQLNENLEKLSPLLAEFSQQPIRHFINSQWVASSTGETFSNNSPIDDSYIGEVAAGTAEDIDTACNAAAEAFDDWAAMPGKQRRELLHAIADAIVTNAEAIALVESWDTGQPLRFMSLSLIHI